MQLMEKGALRPVEWLGRHSFEIYMIHQPAIYAILEALHRLGVF